MKKCPYCAEEIQDAAIVCKHCGRDLAPVVAALPPIETPATPKAGAAKVLVYAVLSAGALIVLAALFSTSTPPANSVAPAPGHAPASSVSGPAVSRRNPTAAQLAGYVKTIGEEPCARATRTFFQGADATSEMWNVECSTGKSFAVSLKTSGDVSVLACSAVKMISKVECFKTFDEQR